MSAEEIDTLLERYLTLLDQYTSLRKELTTLQSSLHQDIARANFSAERGTRYGTDHYDDRMQAANLIQITIPTQNSTLKDEPIPQFAACASTTSSKPRDPLHMFGLFTPSPLKHAQVTAMQMVKEIIPQLVTLDAAMREQEIRIRRARKRLWKSGKTPRVVEMVGGEIDRYNGDVRS